MEPVSDLSDLDFDRPTFFELFAQEQLKSLIGPVIRYVTSVFAHRYPRYLLKLLNSHDEWFAVFMFFVERHYLRTWGASFTETFYGLTRRKVHRSQAVQLSNPFDHTAPNSNYAHQLPKREIRLSLFFLVAVPYIRSKAIDLHERLGGGDNSNLLDDDFAPPQRPSSGQNEPGGSRFARLKIQLGKYFKLLYPYVRLTEELARLFFIFGYLFYKTPHWRPSLHMTGIELRRTSADVQRRMKQELISRRVSPFLRDPVTGLRPGIVTVIKRMLNLASSRAFESLRVVLPCSMLFFKFLEWWYSSSNISRYRRLGNSEGNQVQLIQPPAPIKPNPEGILGGQDGVTKKIRKGNCPVCQMKLVNSTAFPSGWVCCYKCAHAYVSKYQRCPVTLYPASLSDLRKIVG